MCVIVHKPAGTAQPSADTLAQCARRNRDGGGFVLSAPNGKQYLSKGWFDNKRMLSKLDEFADKHDLDLRSCDIVYHYRIATAGQVDAVNTHPFIVDQDAVDELEYNSKNFTALAHNGSFISSIEKLGFSDDTLDQFSDTYLLTKYVLAGNKVTVQRNLLKSLAKAGNKFALMLPNGEVERFGNWKEKDGVFYSNLHHEYKVTYKTYKSGTYKAGTYGGGWKQTQHNTWVKCYHTGSSSQYGRFTYCDECGALLEEDDDYDCDHKDVNQYGYCRDCRDYIPMDYDYEDAYLCSHKKQTLYGSDNESIACADCGAYLGYIPDLKEHDQDCELEDMVMRFSFKYNQDAWHCYRCGAVLNTYGEVLGLFDPDTKDITTT